MELEVGMYVRTEKGISKVVEHKKHESWGYLIKIIGQYSCYTHTSNGELSDVIKASHNIIDLIEVGDYVNNSEVVDFENRYIKEKDKFIRYGVITENCYLENTDSWIIEKNIKSIVTKEQFESMKYEVE